MLEFIEGTLNNYFALIGAAIAMIVSIITLIEARRKSILTSISSNRIVWISELRGLMQKFLKEYLKEENNEYNLRVIRAKIELYLIDAESYNDFLIQLKKCSLSHFTENDYEILVKCTQDILNSAWRKMKREAGIKYGFDRRLTNKIINEKN